MIVSSLLLASIAAAYSEQLVTIELTTEKESYSIGDPIVISGKVSRVIEEQQLIIRVFNPNNIAYSLAQLQVTEDGSFTHKFTVGGKLGIPGTYTIKANYAIVTAEKMIELTPREKASEIVKFAGETFDVRYMIKNAKLLSIEVDPEFLSILIFIQSDAELSGSLEILLPRGLIDAKQDARDKNFIVFVDGEETPYNELESKEDSRRILIEFPEGTGDIEIVGTSVIPEFLGMAGILLAFSMAAIISVLISNKISNERRLIEER